MSREPRTIALTVGDVNGIGIEVMVRALAAHPLPEGWEPVVVGSERLLKEYLEKIPGLNGSVSDGKLRCGDVDVAMHDLPSEGEVSFGRTDARAGKLAGDAVTTAARMALEGTVDAVVTMPISKQALHAGGYDFPGHTELLAHVTGGVPMMILMTEGLRVALVTIHIPLSAVPPLITRDLVLSRLRQFHRTLRIDFGLSDPRIAVLALNPHAGEGGDLGDEEIREITPALERARSLGLNADGPYPADGFFARFLPGGQEGVLAMYHDQGLIPLKFLARGGGVNVTANLPIVRTSPDHGVAFDIAGRGIADERSVIEAIVAAVEIAQRRNEAPKEEDDRPKHR